MKEVVTKYFATNDDRYEMGSQTAPEKYCHHRFLNYTIEINLIDAGIEIGHCVAPDYVQQCWVYRIHLNSKYVGSIDTRFGDVAKHSLRIICDAMTKDYIENESILPRVLLLIVSSYLN